MSPQTYAWQCILISLFIVFCYFPSAQASFGLINYPNVFFEPGHVLNSSWFDDSHWAKEMSRYWAGKLIELGPWSVTNKTILPASGDVHDYLSYAVYYWPNCTDVGNTTELTTEEIWDECKYYQRDGIFNPDINEVQNSDAMENITNSVYLSALAYAATSSPVYSTHINDALHTFFVNNDTRMNPNLNYAQVVRGPGDQLGKHTGVLDMKGMAKIVSGIELLREMDAEEYQAETHDGMVAWAQDQVEWLTTSEIALGEKDAANNHATFYYNQLCSLYVLLDNKTAAAAALEEFYNSTFPGQISANGDQPLESIRTRPYHYRAYNLMALVTNARIGDYVGLDPPAWNRTASSGATIVDALDYAMAQNVTTTNELDQTKALNPVVAAVASIFGDPDGKYAAYLKQTDDYYPGQPWFALSNGISDSGIRQGLIETTYAPSTTSALPTKRALGDRRQDRRRNLRDRLEEPGPTPFP